MSGRTATASPSVESTTARGGDSTGSIDKFDGAWVGDSIPTPPTMNATTYVSSNRLEGFWVEGSESIPLNLARR